MQTEEDVHEELRWKIHWLWFVKELAVEDYKSRDVLKDRYSYDAGHAVSLEQNCNEEHSNGKAEDESFN